ncbi:hypothetical protein [uncultured Pseudokineococcus sp.]|uniref:hypothetical protein n=1 Tax=uncultured Pseudokineococcus sp. TaxID=1642928 RepID=UPI00260F828C|nr:hypothetical protein [uncultured Pseudokineococcus sp.]
MGDDLIDPADPMYELKVAEAFQHTVNGAHEGDDLPVQITVRRAGKIAAGMGSVARGHSGYTDALRDASWFLDAVVAEGRPHTVVSRSASELWAVLDAWPWPRPGKPKDNAE